ncbi:NAD(P)-dependent oxidoreductase [Bradyrhizobium sp. sBnM-33]|uniref:NAD-dependent epimerase/dehydratase family protein n=1 Tax=Bradyrhizobium sp. sBnM-33 TaxID=2831780 RepID=UPI001BCDD998|nr:NAD(P)-dependent oxidoreductase [Bradyrhizobium sp. sBnM-33]WOH48469.1 NAD(P)-dependent oxidoreductase [Bradyrhizobium sp. sBnM-33]
MKILVFGGTGFVGLNIAAALLARGHAVTVFDRADLPPDARKDFASHGERLKAIHGDVTDRRAVEAVIAAGYDAIVLGATITAGPGREATDPEAILWVNLLAQIPILIAAQRFSAGRIINLSSAAAYGASAFRNVLLDEGTPCDPASLYAITKFASEKVAARLAGLWQREIISVRLSAVFGPWERSNEVRDTPSPQAQILAAMQEGREAVLARPGFRDWIYAVDVAEAVMLLIEASKPKHQLYNISTGLEWSALQWGQELAALHSGFICRLTDAGQVATVDLHSPADRAPLSVARMAEEFGWRARFGCADSATDLSRWWTEHRGGNLT